MAMPTTRREAAADWRRDLFGSPWRSVTTLVLAALALTVAARVLPWTIGRAVARPDAEACRALDHAGACWGVVVEKFRAIIFGRYPYAQQWRPATGTAALLVLAAISAWPRCWRRWLAGAWMIALFGFVLLMRGSTVLGWEIVPTSRWSGLPLSLLLSLLALALALPLGVLLALGRRSELPLLRALCRTYIELVRGVPLISVLFMAAFLLPLLVPHGWQPDIFLRVLMGLAGFAAAYLAEVVRGGLQAVPSGQLDSARALGLRRWQVQRFIVLPQALRAVVPSLMNSVIGTVKDSSLVTVVGLYELTGALSLALGGDPIWRPFYLEGYLFISFLYWGACFALSRYSRWLERRLRTPL
ncbi:MAG TPA: amino acid ABC transporter permease [Polyangia bacterium]|jgi:general L-amino acid transport system permease protein|nr:amino acid ABC transporter permease [Polyangia bacterium]